MLEEEIKTIGDLFKSTKYASITLSFPYGHCDLNGHMRKIDDTIWMHKCCLHESTPIHKSRGLYGEDSWTISIRGEQ
tara:strand:- start:34484 stop:34714 length:231 start_codon:yes stop_codon:yes gene_type:complete